MRFFMSVVLMMVSLGLTAESWFGFCIVQRERDRVCSAVHPREGDFSPICDAFARSEGQLAWRAQFANDLSYLKLLMADYCDIVRDDQGGGVYGCQISTYCPAESELDKRHLGSRVYAANEKEAIDACYEKEDWHYQQELKQASYNGCFASIVVEKMR